MDRAAVIAAAASAAAPASLRTAPRPRCLLCGSAGRVLHEAVADHFFHVPGNWTLKRCPDPRCGLVWQDPMLVAEDIGRAYDGYYTSAQPDRSGADTGRGLDATFYRLDRWVTALLQLDVERRRHAASYLDDMAPGTLLDVGCGSGAYASAMQARGWNVRGTEFDPLAAHTATTTYGISVDVGELAAIAYPDSAFDAITARHVLEHVQEPVGFLAECWRILRPGGRLVVVTPNVDSLGHRHFAERWRGLEQPRHLFLYGSASLRALLGRIGADSVEVFTSAQGSDYVLRSSYATSRGAWRRAIDYLAIWRLQFAGTAGTRRGRDVGEELIAVATKAAG
jgi:2-polyprenyl-3-methyl-5-hydroxy-6-metoxy-1,4-benzoquinol methylase